MNEIETQVLRAVRQHGPVTVRECADLVPISEPYAQRILARLHAGGRVNRQRVRGRQGRAPYVYEAQP